MNYCLVRILGNDLPPRHGKSQTLRNLEFNLKNEQNFENCKKHWILNRIIDLEQETAIEKLLIENQQSYLKLPFVLEGYQKDWTFLKKIQHIIQLNKARNIALSQLATGSDWIFPLDGAIFFTPEGWSSVTAYLEGAKEELVKIAMYRVRFDNNEALKFDLSKSFAQEPQVVIRSGSPIRFDESLSYGYQNKEKLLQQFPDANCLDYVIRLNDYTAGFITKKRWKDRDIALSNLITLVENKL